MAARKIKLKDQLGRVVRVPAATAAPTPTTPSVTQPETARPAATVWKLIREIPENIQKLAKLVGTGFTTRGADGEWHQRSIAQGEGIAVTNGDGVDGNPTVALEELANAGGGSLQKTLRDDYGRVAGTSAATTTDLSEGDNLYYTDLRADARISAQKGAANGLATLDSGAKLPANQLPALAITDTFVVASQSAMLVLAAERGDVAVRTDLQKSFILTAEPAATLSNWQELLVPTGNPGTVTSVALSVPTGLSVAGSPITASGTFTITYAAGYQGYLAAESAKLAGLAAGATVGATWGTNLAGIPANITSWAGIAPASKADDSGVIHIAGTETVTGQKTFDSDLIVSGSGRMIRTDLSSSAAVRTKIQTTMVGGATNVTLIPNAVLQQSIITLFNSSDAGNASGAQFAANLAECQFNSVATGSAAVFPWSFKINNALLLRVDLDGTVRGGADNSQNLGAPGQRWAVVYAGTGTISTSDGREKTMVRPLTAAELAAAVELGRDIGVYQWLAMLAEKGDAARQHVGLTVQDAIAIIQSHGLEPFAYGFICYDQWPEQAEILGDDGEIVQLHRPAGDRYSFRMDELLAFIARGMAHRLDAMEQRLTAAGI